MPTFQAAESICGARHGASIPAPSSAESVHHTLVHHTSHHCGCALKVALALDLLSPASTSCWTCWMPQLVLGTENPVCDVEVVPKTWLPLGRASLGNASSHCMHHSHHPCSLAGHGWGEDGSATALKTHQPEPQGRSNPSTIGLLS